mgnify:CR=1 FL=1
MATLERLSAAVRPEHRKYGPGYGSVMAAFTHLNPNGSRSPRRLRARRISLSVAPGMNSITSTTSSGVTAMSRTSSPSFVTVAS